MRGAGLFIPPPPLPLFQASVFFFATRALHGSARAAASSHCPRRSTVAPIFVPSEALGVASVTAIVCLGLCYSVEAKALCTLIPPPPKK